MCDITNSLLTDPTILEWMIHTLNYFVGYATNPETWNNVADEFIGGIAGAIGALIAGWMFNRLERRLRRRAPRHRADG